MYKVCTERTIRAIFNGGPSYWRLSDPLRTGLTVRGNFLIVTQDTLLRSWLTSAQHWSPFDTGGVKAGIVQVDRSLVDVYWDRASLKLLLDACFVNSDVRRLVRAGLPLKEEDVSLGATPDRFLKSPVASSAPWVYEVALTDAPPLRAEELDLVVFPAPARKLISELVGKNNAKRVGLEFDPRWGIDEFDLGSN